MKKRIIALAVAAMAVLGAKAQYVENGHEAVDLGLSVLWATTNIGSTSEHGYGNYYAWGETSTKYSYAWENYRYGSSYKDTSISDILEGNVLKASNDAAAKSWGGRWRMPYYNEIMELIRNCYWEHTANYKSSGVSGYIVYKVKSDADKGIGASGKSGTPANSYSLTDTHIFLPAAGYKEAESVNYQNTGTVYWAGEEETLLRSPYTMGDYYLNIPEEESNSGFDNFSTRRLCLGLPVRAVVSKARTISDIPEGWTVNGQTPVEGKVTVTMGEEVIVTTSATGIPAGKKIKSIKAVPVE